LTEFPYNTCMMRKIFKTGHSLAITLSSGVLQKAGLAEGDAVGVEYDEGRQEIVIRPAARASQLKFELKSRPRLGSKIHG
jgi:antitoxin component of MazEF toxin-antitoxin module